MNEENNRDIRDIVKSAIKFIKKLWPAIGILAGYFAGFLANEELFEQFLENHWSKPDIIYTIEDENEYFKTDIELKDGTLAIYPQLLIQENDTIIRMIALNGIYSETTDLNYKEEIKGFQTKKGSWDTARDFAASIQTELSKQGKKVTTHFAILMELNYRNKKSHKYKTKYYFMLDMKVNGISQSEANEIVEDYPINLEDWEKELDTIIDDCINAVQKEGT